MRKIVKNILKEYDKQFFIKESFDRPFININKIDEFNYLCGDDKPMVKFTIRPYYNKIDCEEYLLEEVKTKIYEISWDWVVDTTQDDKTTPNWVKATTSSIKVIDNFIKDLEPNIILFNETEKTDIIYRGSNFIDKIRGIFDNQFLICSNYNNELDVNRIYLIKKSLTNYGLEKINKTHEQCGGDINLIREDILYPKKSKLKGIKKKLYKENQLKRIILNTIYR